MFLVTGGAGFIGSNLVHALSARGAEVTVSDRLRAGGKWRNLQGAVIAGLVPPDDLPRWLDASQGGARDLEAVFHLGAVSATTVTDGDRVAEANLNLTLRLWDWCARHRVPFVYASSAATYGDGSTGFDDDPHPDALARFAPLNLYGWSKHATDRRIAQMVARGHPAPPHWAGLKFFNVYGPREAHKGRMASVVLHKWRQVGRGLPATLFASDREGVEDGGQMRDFVHVDDCVAAMLWLAEHPTVSGLFNLGTGRARSFADLARAVFAAANVAPDIEYVAMPEDLRGKYQYFTEARMDRLRAAGFDHPPTGLEEGVSSYVRWLAAHPHEAAGDDA